MSVWTINNQTPASLGITVAGGEFCSGRASSVRLACNQNFDGLEKFPYNSTVTIKRDGTPYFIGRVRQIPKSGSAATEGHDYLVEDAWTDLEQLTYQEPWAIRLAANLPIIAYSPTVILGMSSAGVRINVGQQISAALSFALANSISLIIGNIPTGMLLWPSKANGMSCAAVIRDCLKYYPDWIPWLDHTTSPPTFHVTPRASAASTSISITACSSISVTKTQDRLPAGVRIVYLTSGLIGDEVYRTMAIDQFPGVSQATKLAPAGLGILVTTVELAGIKAPIQKQQIETRNLPTGTSGAKDYLKIKFPTIKDVPDAHIDITEWTTAVITDAAGAPIPIDPKLPRLPGNTRGDLPRELVKGNVTEWMQKKVGKVLIEMKVKAGSAASETDKKKIESIPRSLTVVCTNAVTKIYQGLSSYTAAESVPVGIAQAFYQTLQNGCSFEGQITLEGEEITLSPFHGRNLHLTGSGNTEWATMGAPVHHVSWDLETCQTTVSFGPNPEYSVQDFLEFLRLLNKRENNEYTTQERTGDKLGSEQGISANGDTAGPYDSPETITGGGAVAPPQSPFALVASGTPGDNKLDVLTSLIASQEPPGFATGKKTFTIADSEGKIYAKMTINATTGLVLSVAVEKGADVPANTDEIYYQLIGQYSVTGGGSGAVITAYNHRYGPIPALICREYNTTVAPFFQITFL